MFKIKNLKVSYKKNTILDIGSFSFDKKGLCVIVGPNGSGKTTLLKSLINLLNYEGEIYYNDVDIKEYGSDLYKKVCYIDQFGNLIDSLSEKENYNILNELNIHVTDKFLERRISKVSGGQRKVIEEKRLNALNYETYLLDEPTTSLDNLHKDEFLKRISELSKDKLVIIVTHDEDVINIADKVIDISNLNNEFEIDKKEYKKSEGQEISKKSIFKLAFSNPILKIFTLLMYIAFTFSSLLLFNLNEYSSNTISKDLLSNTKYDTITSSSLYNDYINYHNGEYITDYASIGLNGSKSITVLHNRDIPTFGIDKNPALYYPLKDLDFDGVIITDYLSYLLFGDTDNHIGESFNLLTRKNSTVTITLTITDMFDTFFDPIEYESIINKSDSNQIASTIDFLNTKLGYILISNDKCNEIINDYDASFFGFVLKNGDELPKGYSFSYTFFANDTTILVTSYKIYGLIICIGSLALMIYTSYASKYISKNKLTNFKKMKSLGVMNKDISKINDLATIIISLIAFILSFIAYYLVDRINYAYTLDMFINNNAKYIYSKYYYSIVIFIILAVIFYFKKIIFNNKFKENN